MWSKSRDSIVVENWSHSKVISSVLANNCHWCHYADIWVCCLTANMYLHWLVLIESNEASLTDRSKFTYNILQRYLTTIGTNKHKRKVLPRNHLETSEQVAASCCMRLQILRWLLCSLDNSPSTPTSKSKHTLGWSLTIAAPVALLFLGLSPFSLIHGGLTKSHVPQGATKTWSTLVLQKMGWYR